MKIEKHLIQDTNEVVELDSLKASELRRFSLKPCEEPAGLALDAEHHRAFSSCHNKTMTILDTTTGKVIATVPIGERVDGTGLAFSANGDGTLTVARETSPGNFEVTATVSTQLGSRTMAIDPITHYIYLPAAQFSRAKEPTPEGSRQRPVMARDSFEVLVVGK